MNLTRLDFDVGMDILIKIFTMVCDTLNHVWLIVERTIISILLRIPSFSSQAVPIPRHMRTKCVWELRQVEFSSNNLTLLT